MNHPEKNSSLVNPRILVAPIDWGLGHTTRCIPIIKELLSLNCEVWLAGNAGQKALLETEFSGLPFLRLPGYNITYSKTKRGLALKMLLQIPKIFSVIKMEKEWLNGIIEQYGFDAVISDNRFGLYHKAVPSIFITHQLQIKTGLGKVSESFLRRWNYKQINHFTECWVPDVSDKNNLAEELSHPSVKPKIPVHYIGPLSRFEKISDSEISGHLLFILSGPEPQRTIFENKIIEQVSHYNGTCTIVRGLPASYTIMPSTNMIKFYNHLSTPELNKEINQAKWIIARSGYTTLMDVVKLQKKSILIPTPGQTEQEYLAKQSHKKNLCYCADQKNFSLQKVLSAANDFEYKFNNLHFSDSLKTVLQNFISSLR